MKLTVGNDSGLFDSEATLNAISNSLVTAKGDGVVKMQYIVNTSDYGFSEHEEQMITAACLWILEILKGRGYGGFIQEQRRSIRMFVLFTSESEYNKFLRGLSLGTWKGTSDSRADKLWNPKIDPDKWNELNIRKAVWDPDFSKDYPIRHPEPHDLSQYYGLADYTREQVTKQAKTFDIRLKSDFFPHLQSDQYFYGDFGGKAEFLLSRSIQAKDELKKFIEFHLSHVPPVYRRQIVNELLDGVDGNVWQEVDKDENVKIEPSIKWSDDNGQSKITLVVDLLKITPKAIDGISIE